MRNQLRLGVTTASFLVALSAQPVFATPTVVLVTPVTPNGWQTFDTTGCGNPGGTAVTQFVTGPGTPPVGSGSVNFIATSPGCQSAQITTCQFEGTKLSSLTSLSYNTFATAWNGAQVPFLEFSLSKCGGTVGNDFLFFEPVYSDKFAGNGNPCPQACPTLDTWQTWNVLNGRVYAANATGCFDFGGPGSCAKGFACYLHCNPCATIVDEPDGFGGVKFGSGFGCSGCDFNANVDSFTIGTATQTTTFEFQPGVAVPEVDPKPSDAVGPLAFLGSLLLLFTDARRRQAKTGAG